MGMKVKLLLLTSIHPAPISRQLETQLKQKIQDSRLSDYITLNTDYLEEEQIVSKLASADKVLFLYGNTQESSSAAIRMGLLAQKEVITTPIKIFDDVKSVVTQTKDGTPDAVMQTIIHSLNTPFNNTKLKEFIEEYSWGNISKEFYSQLAKVTL